jgi:hypothetical protein
MGVGTCGAVGDTAAADAAVDGAAVGGAGGALVRAERVRSMAGVVVGRAGDAGRDDCVDDAEVASCGCRGAGAATDRGRTGGGAAGSGAAGSAATGSGGGGLKTVVSEGMPPDGVSCSEGTAPPASAASAAATSILF